MPSNVVFTSDTAIASPFVAQAPESIFLVPDEQPRDRGEAELPHLRQVILQPNSSESSHSGQFYPKSFCPMLDE